MSQEIPPAGVACMSWGRSLLEADLVARTLSHSQNFERTFLNGMFNTISLSSMSFNFPANDVTFKRGNC